MSNLVTSLSSASHVLPATQVMPTPPANRKRFSYMPPYAKILPKVTPPIPTPQPATSTTASLSLRIKTTPATPKELTTQNYPQYWQKKSAPPFEKLFPKIFAKYRGFELTQQQLLSQDDTEKNLATLVLIDYLSGPPMQGLKNEETVFYFLDCIQLAVSLSKMKLPPLQSETVNECLQEFLFQVFLTIDDRFYPQVADFLNLNDGDEFEAAKERILAHSRISATVIASEDDDELPLQRNKRQCTPPSTAAISSISKSTRTTSSAKLQFVKKLENIKNNKTLINSIDELNICSIYKSYILDPLSRWTPVPFFKTTYSQKLPWDGPVFNQELLFLAYSEPQLFREVTLGGTFEKMESTASLTPLNEQPETVRQKEEAYELLKKGGAEVCSKYPLRRNTWQDLPPNATTTDKVGRNPFLEQNFASVQKLLYYLGHLVRLAIANDDSTFLDRLKRRDPAALSTFFNYVAYWIVQKKNVTSIDEGTVLSLKGKVLGEEIIAYINHDTFDLGYAHFNQRLFPNEPNLIRDLLPSIHARWNCQFFKYSTWKNFLKSSNENDYSVKLLIQGMANGIRERYFFSDNDDLGRYPFTRIFRLPNAPLQRVLDGFPLTQYTE